MATTGEILFTGAQSINESPWLDEPWVNPTNALADDGAYAQVTATTFDNGDQTAVLKVFGADSALAAALPSDLTSIDGVIVRIQAHADSVNVGIDLVQLLDVSRAKVGTNKSDTTQRVTASDAVYTFGASNDLWGNALTRAWLIDADFGVAIGGHAYTNNSEIYIDYVSVEVFYTPVPPTPKAGADSGSGSGASAVSVSLPRTEAGAGSETRVLAVPALISWAALSIPATPSTQKSGTDTGSGSEVSAQVVVLSRTESGAGVDTSVESVPYTRVDSGSGTDISVVQVPKSVVDSASASDGALLQVAGAGVDSSSGTELSSTSVSLQASDSGAGTDASAVARVYVVTQSGVGTDASAENATYALTETGSGTDVSTLQAGNAKHGTDTGVGSDASTERVAYTRADVGAGVDASSLNQGAVNKVGVDAGSGVDSSSLVASLVTSEASVGIDLRVFQASLSRADVGAGTETSVRRVGVATAQSGTASDAAFLHALNLASDTAHVVETAVILAILSVATDAGTGLDNASLWKGGIPPMRLGGTIVLNRGGEHSTMQGSRPGSSVTPRRPDAEVT